MDNKEVPQHLLYFRMMSEASAHMSINLPSWANPLAEQNHPIRRTWYHNAFHPVRMWDIYKFQCPLKPRTNVESEELMAMLFAIAYHDVVYEQRMLPSENELASANRLQADFAKAPVSERPNYQRAVLLAVDMILATGNHMAAATPLTIRFCDLDLAALAFRWDEFEYNNKVLLRNEFDYGHANTMDQLSRAHADEIYARKQYAFFTYMLSQPRIYRSNFWPEWWEDTARFNMERAVRIIELRFGVTKREA